jgi:hypothetical protein
MKTRQAIQEILSEIPDDRLEEALSYLNYLRFKEEWEATEEILRDKKLMQSWQRGKRQAERGQTVSLSELKRRLPRRV